MLLPVLRRRSLVAGASAAVVSLPALPQPGRTAQPPIAVAQIHDASAGAQDVTKDFLAGARAAWQDINARGGVRGRPVEHLAIAAEPAPRALQQAWQAARDHTACVALSATAGDTVASELVALLRREDAAIAHAAPWLQNSGVEPDDRTFAIFAGRQEQIAHAIKSLSISGVQDVGAVFASEREAARYREEVMRAGALLKVRITAWTASGDLASMGTRLGPASPAVLLFVGGTPELVQFTRGLERQARQRYVVALADVNLQTVHQMGGGRTAPVIGTQAVPMVTSALPIVRRYREKMGRLFDEEPVALSLAGFIAARYTYEVLAGIEGPITRASVLAAFQRRSELDLGGYRIRFEGRGRGPGFVTQSMLTPDGRVVG